MADADPSAAEIAALQQSLVDKQAALDEFNAEEQSDQPPYDADEMALLQLIAYMRSPLQEEIEVAVFTLSEMVSNSFDDDGARLGAIMREQNGLSQLTWLLADSTQPVDVHQQALLLLGNLCSDSVDRNSMLSKRYLLLSGVERVLFHFLKADDEFTLMFACGLVQNLCHDAEWSARAMAHGVDASLARLLAHEDDNVVKYAAGALKNISSTGGTDLEGAAKSIIDQRAKDVALRKFKERWAFRVIANFAAKNMPSDARIRRVLTARGMISRPDTVELQQRREEDAAVRQAERDGVPYQPTGGPDGGLGPTSEEEAEAEAAAAGVGGAGAPWAPGVSAINAARPATALSAEEEAALGAEEAAAAAASSAEEEEATVSRRRAELEAEAVAAAEHELATLGAQRAEAEALGALDEAARLAGEAEAAQRAEAARAEAVLRDEEAREAARKAKVGGRWKLGGAAAVAQVKNARDAAKGGDMASAASKLAREESMKSAEQRKADLIAAGRYSKFQEHFDKLREEEEAIRCAQRRSLPLARIPSLGLRSSPPASVSAPLPLPRPPLLTWPRPPPSSPSPGLPPLAAGPSARSSARSAR